MLSQAGEVEIRKKWTKKNREGETLKCIRIDHWGQDLSKAGCKI